MDPARWGTMRWGYFRWGVYDPKFDEAMDALKKQAACHLGNCAPAVWGPGGARWAGTVSGGTLHCRWNVKIPRFDELMERMKK